MFVFSVKTSRKQLAWLIACAVGLVAVVLLAVLWPGDSAPTSASLEDRSSRIAYLQALGYVVDPDSEQVREVLIPDEFDDAFVQYNELQQTAGMDLTPYHGKRVKCWSYSVLNFPGDEAAQAHLYVYDNRVIGGDISAVVYGGNAVGLIPIEEVKTGATESGTTG